MKFLDRWLTVAGTASRLAIRCAGAVIFLSAVVVGVDVVGRKFFVLSLGGADEISGYAFAIATSWALAFTLLQRANVRVDALYIHLPRPLAACLDLLALLALGLFVGTLAWFAGKVLQDSLLFDTRANTPLGTPQWVPQTLWLLGFVLFLFAWLPLVLRAVAALAAGDVARVQALAGARSVGEDAADEVSHTKTLETVPLGGRV